MGLRVSSGVSALLPPPFFSKGAKAKQCPPEVADMADVTNTAIPDASATVMAMTAMAMATTTDVTAQFPPLKKGGRGDLLLLFVEAKQQQIPPLIAARSATPFPKVGHCNNHRRAEFSRSHT